ncbi:MAG: hypothetical protein KF842_04270 [Caulobacter sp.]|nr:hypothetical protein [Caulobacter sp.]
MEDFILLMHDDTTSPPAPELWDAYFADLAGQGVFEGGSAIGQGEVFRKGLPPGSPSPHLTGFIRVRAANLREAARLLVGNPVYECGGTVEIRALPRD